MTDPAARQELTELYAGQGWTAAAEELLHRSLGPRGPELLLEAPGWLGLAAGQLVLEAGCRDATHALVLAGRYGCRVLGVDLVADWLPRAEAVLGPVWYRRASGSPAGGCRSCWAGSCRVLYALRRK